MADEAKQSPFEPGAGVPDDPAKRVGELKERRDEGLKWMQDNYWEEFEDVYRAAKCRTKPIMVKNKKGKEEEDKSRTNVCMPELAVLIRRKTARITANPPTLNYDVPGDGPDLLSERLTARAYYEYDRSGESWEIKRGVQMANTFGFTYFKTYYDQVEVIRQMRYLRAKLTDRAQLMKLQGASPEETDAAIAARGAEVPEAEVAAAIQQSGPELRGEIPTTIYSGPVTKCRFIGDIILEPGCLNLRASDFVGDQYTETDLWLRMMLQKTYTDPETGQEIPVFTEKSVKELMDQDSKDERDRKFDLKRELRDAIQMTQVKFSKRLLANKRYDIYEHHSQDKYGRWWAEYMGNDSVYLGRHPYAVDYCGDNCYSEFVPWPDLIGAIGDSSPRLLRFLHAMHNAAVGQRNDLITNILRRTYKVDNAEDIPDEVIERKFGRFLLVKSMGSLQAQEEPDVPASAWETEGQIIAEMQRMEPAIGGVEAQGTGYNPQSGKLATTAILAAKSSDVLTAYEIENFNFAIGDIAKKKLEIHRQLADEPIPVPNRNKYIKTEALTQRYDKVRTITIDPYEIQDPLIEVEPIAGSTLAVDDEIRANKIQTIYAAAEADPVTWNKPEAAKLMLSTVKGVGDTSKLLNDPTAAKPAGPKVSVNISIPLDKAKQIPADILNPLLAEAGIPPSQDVAAAQKLDAVSALSTAADAATNLTSEAKTEDDKKLEAATKKVETKVNGKAATRKQ